jgi:hypothetical protein
MKRQSLCYFVALPAMLLALSAQAHDPKEHMKETQAPDCAVMKDMDHSKMDMKDPVMQAMMQKCMKAMHKDEGGSHEAHGEEGHAVQGKQDEKADEKKPAKHQHKQ